MNLHQASYGSPEDALREAIAKLPYDDGTGPFDEELEWLQCIASGDAEVSFLDVTSCINTWLWKEGCAYDPQYICYIVQTDIAGS